MHPKLPKCDRCWSRSMSSNRKVSRSRSRQVVAWDLHSHLSLEKNNGIEQLFLFFCFIFLQMCHSVKCIGVSIVFYHPASCGLCEELWRYIYIYVKMFARHEVSKKIGSETRLVQTRKIYYIHNSWKPKPIKNAEVDTDLQRKPITWITHISCRFSWNRSRRMLFAQRESDTTGTNMVA